MQVGQVVGQVDGAVRGGVGRVVDLDHQKGGEDFGFPFLAGTEQGAAEDAPNRPGRRFRQWYFW
jgi:hypothetical protein